MSSPYEALWHQSLTRRMRSLLKSGPLHGLHLAESRRAAVLEHDDLLALCLKAMETLVDAVGLKEGATLEELAESLLPLLRANDLAHDVQPSSERHHQLVQAVVGVLLNDAGRRQPYEERYLEFVEDRPVHRLLRFRLASEQEALDGRIVIRAETDGINLFLRSLDMDLEDAQAAVEAVMQVQLQRGRYDLALLAAREAQIRSIQYREQIETLIRRTRRDVGGVDWRHEVPTLIKQATAHIRERVDVERELCHVAEQSLEKLLDSEQAPRLVQILSLTEDCFRRHTELHQRLINIYDIFRQEQARQRFAPIPLKPLPNLDSELLSRTLASPREAALFACDAFALAALPPKPPPLIDLGTLWDRLLLPPRKVHALGPELVEKRALTSLEEPVPWFDEALIQRVDRVLMGLDKTTALDELLDRFPHRGEQHFACLRFLQHFAPEDGAVLPLHVSLDGQPFNRAYFRGDRLFGETGAKSEQEEGEADVEASGAQRTFSPAADRPKEPQIASPPFHYPAAPTGRKDVPHER